VTGDPSIPVAHGTGSERHSGMPAGALVEPGRDDARDRGHHAGSHGADDNVDIAYHLLTERALNKDDIGLVRLMTKRVAACMRDYGIRVSCAQSKGRGSNNLWETIP